jgi:hypothetical protein
VLSDIVVGSKKKLLHVKNEKKEREKNSRRDENL